MSQAGAQDGEQTKHYLCLLVRRPGRDDKAMQRWKRAFGPSASLAVLALPHHRRGSNSSCASSYTSVIHESCIPRDLAKLIGR